MTEARAEGLEGVLRELADACEDLLPYVRVGAGPLGPDPAAIAMRRAVDAIVAARDVAQEPTA